MMLPAAAVLSTIGEDAPALARRLGLGLEVAEYCTAWRMDREFPATPRQVCQSMEGVERFVFHAPFNELCPAAVDPLAVELAEKRWWQAVKLAGRYGIRRMVVHSGYVPWIYHKEWFEDRSVEFWRRFMRDFPQEGFLYLENVMEDGPELLCRIVQRVDDPRFRLCLDLGHAHAELSRTPLMAWVEACAPLLGHVHLHDNRGGEDLHLPLGEGTAPVEEALIRLETLCPGLTYTVENMRAAPSVAWLERHGFWEG